MRPSGEAGHGASGWRAIEWFAGIGGFACAWPECEVIAAIDIDRTAQSVYQRNWPHRYLVNEIGSIDAERLSRLGGNLWWLSPPCQPYSRRGRQADIADSRARSLLHLIGLIPQLRPQALVLENVSGFRQSLARELLEKTLVDCGYTVAYREICPTELGWPNRRPRFYLIASLSSPLPWRPLPCRHVTLADLLRSVTGAGQTEAEEEACRISQREQALYGNAMDRVDPSQRDAVTACFGSSYGKSLLHAGSYLVTGDHWRRFTPLEVARLLGYPATFTMPAELGRRRAWSLLGNSLAIPVVRYVLSHLPDYPSMQVTRRG